MPQKARQPWTRKQWLTRRTCLDRLNFWQANGYQCLWVTFTSSPASSADQLRKHFQTLRKRLARQLGFDDIEYVCVDTREGHGVLHMLWAWKDPDQRRGSFYVPFEWLQENWKAIHGAFHVNVKRIGGSTKDARRLSRYLVSQYCGNQSGLVRLSQSKPERPLSKMREALRRALKSMPERHQFAATLPNLPLVEFGQQLNRALWQAFKRSWDELVRFGSCELLTVKFVWLDGQLVRV